MFALPSLGLSAPGRKKIILTTIGIITAALIGAVAFLYFSTANKINKILPGNPVGAITKSDPLKTDNGQTNILLFGTSSDDPNPSHTGGQLTDSIVVLSIDGQANDAYMISIPRDLWVDYSTPCKLGDSGKINSVYSCALSTYGSSEKDKASLILADEVEEVVGLQIQYYVEINYNFVKSLTDALGGIDVDVYSADSRGIYDPQVGLKLPAGMNHLDGKTALKLARARNSHGGYGLPRSNFDREINQQRIITALFKKASSGGTLSNANNALKLINSLSGQVRTNVQTSELKSAISTAQSLKADKIISVPLTSYMTTDLIGSQSVVCPSIGLGNYSAIQAYISATISAGVTE